MLQKIIHAATKPKNLFLARPKFTPSPLEDGGSSSALRIIHAGGIVEQYYMAIPASRIIEKYPSFTLTRPDVFRRPWDAVVRPEEMLIPGQKYFVVPCRTVKKLKRRIKKPSGINSALFFKSVESSSVELDSSQQKNEFFSSSNKAKSSSAGIMVKSKNKTKVGNLRVRFFGIDRKQDSGSASSEQSTNSAESIGKAPNPHADARKWRAGNAVQWEPSLTSIKENHEADE